MRFVESNSTQRGKRRLLKCLEDYFDYEYDDMKNKIRVNEVSKKPNLTQRRYKRWRIFLTRRGLL